jgi:type IV secretory pathway TrbF-like protein
VRASSDPFEIRWKEQTYENGAIMRTERFTGVATVIFNTSSTAEPLRNPSVFSVYAFNWSRDLI